jgi:hypothetical protein
LNKHRRYRCDVGPRLLQSAATTLSAGCSIIKPLKDRPE